MNGARLFPLPLVLSKGFPPARCFASVPGFFWLCGYSPALLTRDPIKILHIAFDFSACRV